MPIHVDVKMIHFDFKMDWHSANSMFTPNLMFLPSKYRGLKFRTMCLAAGSVSGRGAGAGRPSGGDGGVVLAVVNACVGYWYAPGALVLALLPCECVMAAWPVTLHATLETCGCLDVCRAGKFWL